LASPSASEGLETRCVEEETEVRRAW
jgi:hypothetical protein